MEGWLCLTPLSCFNVPNILIYDRYAWYGHHGCLVDIWLRFEIHFAKFKWKCCMLSIPSLVVFNKNFDMFMILRSIQIYMIDLWSENTHLDALSIMKMTSYMPYCHAIESCHICLWMFKFTMLDMNITWTASFVWCLCILVRIHIFTVMYFHLPCIAFYHMFHAYSHRHSWIK